MSDNKKDSLCDIVTNTSYLHSSKLTRIDFIKQITEEEISQPNLYRKVQAAAHMKINLFHQS